MQVLLFLVILMFGGHLILTTHVCRCGAQEGSSDGPNTIQGMRSRQDWNGTHLTLLNVAASKRPQSAHSHIPTCSSNNIGLYDLLSQPLCFVPLAFTLMLQLATPKCVPDASLGSLCVIPPFLHACYLVYWTEAICVYRRNE